MQQQQQFTRLIDAGHQSVAKTSLVSPAFDDVDYTDVLEEISEIARFTLDEGWDD